MEHLLKYLFRLMPHSAGSGTPGGDSPLKLPSVGQSPLKLCSSLGTDIDSSFASSQTHLFADGKCHFIFQFFFHVTECELVCIKLNSCVLTPLSLARILVSLDIGYMEFI